MSLPVPPGVDRVLFSGELVNQRIQDLAAQISERYRGRDLKLIGVLKGSIFFLTALARAIDVPVKIDFLSISSFSNKKGSAGLVRIAKDLDERGPNSMALCTLLDRTSRRIVQVPVDYRCFEIGDHFVIGCGLDYKQLYRNLDYIAVMNPLLLDR
jgi:hypoxanthine phosphoribosyltransferase